VEENPDATKHLELAIESLNKAMAVLGVGQGITGGIADVARRAGCQEYCGSYDGCTGYCKPMGAALQGEEVSLPAQRQAAATRLPFSG
jgi:hypothetical protein